MGKKVRGLSLWRRLIWKLMRNTSLLWPDRLYLKTSYRLLTNRKLNLDNPRGLNEKIQWLKLHDHRELCTLVVDKVKVKDWVAAKIGEQYIIPTLGVWESAEDVDFDALPDKFVIKCNHNSQIGTYICKDKSKMDEKAVREGLKKGLRQDFWRVHREWAYKDVPRRILAEELLETDGAKDLEDFKIFCMNGKARMCVHCTDRFGEEGVYMTFYSIDWKKLPFTRRYLAREDEAERPATFDEMVRLAEKLAADFPLARIDFYDVKGRVYFGEITLYPQAGVDPFEPEEWEYKLGDMLDLGINK